MKPLALTTVACLIACGALAGATGPLIIGHRGASGHRPEHTIEAYRLAAQMGADYIEPDLVATRDGVLIARHENEIGGTTDAGVRFPDRKRTKTIDGRAVTGWFSEDFTLAEIRTLTARERLPFRSHAYDGQFAVPTFDEVLELAVTLGRDMGRPIGVYPETKHPGYFASIGLPLEPRLIDALAHRNWNRPEAPVLIQSFEEGSLRLLGPLTRLPLVQLLGADAAPVTDARLRAIAGYAQAVGLHQHLIVPAAAGSRTTDPTDIVGRAHAAGLKVHVWTLRDESRFLSPLYKGDPKAEYRHYAALGVDGVFTDFPDTARTALR